jgi:hypothetical protein
MFDALVRFLGEADVMFFLLAVLSASVYWSCNRAWHIWQGTRNLIIVRAAVKEYFKNHPDAEAAYLKGRETRADRLPD